MTVSSRVSFWPRTAAPEKSSKDFALAYLESFFTRRPKPPTKYGLEKSMDCLRSFVADMPAIITSIWPLLRASIRPEKLILTATGSMPSALPTTFANWTS